MKESKNASSIRKPRLLRSQLGVSLIELMIVVGLLGIVSLGVTQLVISVVHSQNGINYRSQFETITEEIRGYLSSEAACLATFNPVALTAATNANVVSVRDSNGVARFTAGTRYGVPTLVSLNLRNYTHATGVAGEAILDIRFTATTPVNGPKDYAREIRIRTERDGANILTKCIATAKMNDGIWQRQPASLENVFFPGERVGIGSVTPNHTLEVNGGIGLGEDPFLPDLNFTTNKSYISFQHQGVSEDMIGYRDNTFYFADAPGGADVSHPTVNVLGKFIVGGPNLDASAIPGVLVIGENDEADNVVISSFGTGNGPAFASRKARGSQAAPSPMMAGDYSAGMVGYGFNGSGYVYMGGMILHSEANVAGTSAPSQIRMVTTNAAGTAQTNLVIDSQGNVGVGVPNPTAKLEVAGELKIGATGIGCSATTEGQMRYNSGTKLMEFCNGTTWGNVTPPAPPQPPPPPPEPVDRKCQGNSGEVSEGTLVMLNTNDVMPGVPSSPDPNCSNRRYLCINSTWTFLGASCSADGGANSE